MILHYHKYLERKFWYSQIISRVYLFPNSSRSVLMRLIENLDLKMINFFSEIIYNASSIMSK